MNDKEITPEELIKQVKETEREIQDDEIEKGGK